MIRFWIVIIFSIPYIITFLIHCYFVEKHSDRYSEEERYNIARRVINIVKRKGVIQTAVYGIDNLPKEGGYVMYPNHQGKYDALGIISSHKLPCTVVMDEKRSHMLVMSQFLDLIKGKRLNRDSIESQVKTMRSVVTEVKSGRRYVIFPEGGYEHPNTNIVHDFMPGSFKYAMRAKSPIIPVALIDSFKPFGQNSIKPVKTQVHYLNPICYEEYKGMSSEEIAKLVKKRIEEKISECGKAA